MLKLAVIALAVVAYAEAYSSGAPENACQDMVPKHPVPPQKSAPPYAVTASAKVVKSGSPVQVVVRGKSSSDTIRGLLLQARHQGDKIIGKWTVAPNDPFAQTLNCGAPGNAVTHKKHDEKIESNQVSYTWTPPAGFSGDVKFRATVALNGAVFWVGVESVPLKVQA